MIEKLNPMLIILLPSSTATRAAVAVFTDMSVTPADLHGQIKEDYDCILQDLDHCMGVFEQSVDILCGVVQLYQPRFEMQ